MQPEAITYFASGFPLHCLRCNTGPNLTPWVDVNGFLPTSSRFIYFKELAICVSRF